MAIFRRCAFVTAVNSPCCGIELVPEFQFHSALIADMLDRVDLLLTAKTVSQPQ